MIKESILKVHCLVPVISAILSVSPPSLWSHHSWGSRQPWAEISHLYVFCLNSWPPEWGNIIARLLFYATHCILGWSAMPTDDWNNSTYTWQLRAHLPQAIIISLFVHSHLSAKIRKSGLFGWLWKCVHSNHCSHFDWRLAQDLRELAARLSRINHFKAWNVSRLFTWKMIAPVDGLIHHN